MQTVLKTSGWTAFSVGVGLFGFMRSGLAGTNTYNYTCSKDIMHSSHVMNMGFYDHAVVLTMTKTLKETGETNIQAHADSYITIRPIIVNINQLKDK
uniref:Uncharacterized protein n=1 Tax=viral metagenome TaxID=1070528 RepID=A0A6C0JVP9_9ZZZZ